MEMQFMMKVNSRYFAISGSTSDVGGRILETKSRNTTSDRRIDIPKVTFSPRLWSADGDFNEFHNLNAFDDFNEQRLIERNAVCLMFKIATKDSLVKNWKFQFATEELESS